MATPDYRAYHDLEWGYPVGDDRRLFEKISLEGFQAGLSWRTILNKRDNFRQAFAGFDFDQIAQFDQSAVEQLLRNPGIVRHRGKIEAVIHNARCAQALVREQGSLSAFFWTFEPPATRSAPNPPVSTSPAAIALSKALKQRGWKFVGPTTLYAFMQAMGLVNDHADICHIRERVTEARVAFQLKL